jgi:hypothetical protein
LAATANSSAGPITGMVKQKILCRVFCGRARRLDSKVKEMIPIPTAIPLKKKKKHAKSA